MSPVDAITDYYWRDWARRLPQLEPRLDDAYGTFLASLARTLDDTPASVDALTVEDRRTLIMMLIGHRQTIAYELERAARSARESSMPGAVGGLVSALYAPVATLMAAAQLAFAAFGIGRERRLRQLEREADRLNRLVERIEQRLLGAGR